MCHVDERASELLLQTLELGPHLESKERIERWSYEYDITTGTVAIIYRTDQGNYRISLRLFHIVATLAPSLGFAYWAMTKRVDQATLSMRVDGDDRTSPQIGAYGYEQPADAVLLALGGRHFTGYRKLNPSAALLVLDQHAVVVVALHKGAVATIMPTPRVGSDLVAFQGLVKSATIVGTLGGCWLIHNLFTDGRICEIWLRSVE